MTVFEKCSSAATSQGGALARRRAEAIAARFPLVSERRQSRAGSPVGGEQKIVEIAAR